MSTDEIKLIHIESEIASIKVAQASQEQRLASLASDIRELKKHDEKSDEKQTLILNAIHSIGEKIIPLSHRIDSVERKVAANKEETQASATKLAKQNGEQTEILKKLELESVANNAVNSAKDKQIARLPLWIAVCGAVVSFVNWYLNHR